MCMCGDFSLPTWPLADFKPMSNDVVHVTQLAVHAMQLAVHAMQLAVHVTQLAVHVCSLHVCTMISLINVLTCLQGPPYR
jgi:hypothetical protein